MTLTKVIPATRELISAFLTQRIRQQDINEFVLMSGQRVEDSLSDVDLKTTRVCLSPLGVPLALWGLAGNYGWLIATVEAARWARDIQRHWKRELAMLGLWLGPGEPLWALTMRATTNKRWHEALGFVVHHEDDFTVLYRRDFQWVR